MKVQVIGKSNIQGVSKKTGQEYNSNIVNVIYTVEGTTGYESEKIFLDAEKYPFKDIKIDGMYEIDRNNRGYVVAFNRVPD